MDRVPKKKHRSSKHRPRRPGHPGLRSARQHPEDDWDLLDEVEIALAADHPLTMLQTASAVLNIVDSRNEHPLDPSAKREDVSLPDLLNALIAGARTGRCGAGLDNGASAWKRGAAGPRGP